MPAKVYSAQLVGLKADLIDVEVDVSRGLHSFTIVGLPDKAVEEARDRINAAIKNSGLPSPQKSNKKIIVSLAPADLKKEGPAFDLAIALAYLLANREVRFNPTGKLFLGELALDGALRPIKGALMLVRHAAQSGCQEVYLPQANAAEAALVRGIKVYGCRQLKQLIAHLSPPPTAAEDDKNRPPLVVLAAQPPTEIKTGAETEEWLSDLAEIKGQPTAKRGLEIAAAGGHNLAMFGPPGTGKTMLAKAFGGIMPPLNFDEILEVTGIHSAAGLLASYLITRPPFRSPHHTASYVSLVGGGNWPRPGEITLAHRGVLFLDEFPEFDKQVIEALRQPLEDRVIHVARARATLTFPANFILIAAMNPCPCGNRGLRYRECVCTPAALQRYRRKLSGPIIDRIDLWLEVGQVDHVKLSETESREEPSVKIRDRVVRARACQRERLAAARRGITVNGEMGAKDLKRFSPLTASSIKLLNDSARRLDFSARAYHRVIKLARTIADLAATDQIKDEHLLEALQYRPKLQF